MKGILKTKTFWAAIAGIAGTIWWAGSQRDVHLRGGDGYCWICFDYLYPRCFAEVGYHGKENCIIDTQMWAGSDMGPGHRPMYFDSKGAD